MPSEQTVAAIRYMESRLARIEAAIGPLISGGAGRHALTGLMRGGQPGEVLGNQALGGDPPRYDWFEPLSTTGAGAPDGPGPAGSPSNLDNRAVRYDGTTGLKVQGGPVGIEDDGRVTGLATPTATDDAATKDYVDSSVVTDHGVLTGLSDDDHAQYLRTNGSRPLSDDWDNTGRRVRNTGTVEVTGTAPPAPVTGLAWLDTAASGTGGSGTLTVTTITDDLVLTTSHEVVLCDTALGNIAVSLPAAASNEGRNYHVKKIDSSTNIVTIDADSSEVIDDGLTAVLESQYETVTVVCDGSSWFVI